MRAVFAILLFAFFGSLSIAHADVIVSGSVSTSGSAGGSCSASGSASGSLNLDCEDPQTGGFARAAGSGDAFSGSVTLDAYGGTGGDPATGSAMGFIQLQFNETYVLTGGTGSTTVNFNFYVFDGGGLGPFCGFTFDGMASQPCGSGGFSPPSIPTTTLTETVEYGVPFSVELVAGFSALSLPGEPLDGSLTYDFDQPGLVTTPEPSSALLLLPGLVGVFLAARSRAKVG